MEPVTDRDWANNPDAVQRLIADVLKKPILNKTEELIETVKYTAQCARRCYENSNNLEDAQLGLYTLALLLEEAVNVYEGKQTSL